MRRILGQVKRALRVILGPVLRGTLKLLEPSYVQPPQIKGASETSKCRATLSPYCVGDGVDVGFGGDPIAPHAICMDLPDSYAKYEDNPQHLHGDAADLRWFRDGTLDFVYSSHVLEDFQDTTAVITEWLRVVRPGGHLVLFLPDEPTYRAYCLSQGKPPNPFHIHERFGPDHVKECLKGRDDLEIVHERFPVSIYNFEMVIRKRP